MKKFISIGIFLFLCFLLFSAETIPLTNISLFSSGLGLFEHTGTIPKNGRLELYVPADAINDVLKSLVIINGENSTKQQSKTYNSDAKIGDIVIEYSGAHSLKDAHKSLQIDVSGNPGMAEIFLRLVGETVRVHSSVITEGRILGVEEVFLLAHTKDYRLILSTATGLTTVLISEISTFDFVDASFVQDIEKGLDLFKAERITKTKKIDIYFPQTANKNIKIMYVAPTAVWKTSYRLDLLDSTGFFQAWAIVDNATALDWQSVKLSLVAGRPISFIQNLYEPYFVEREEIPLSIAGAGKGKTHDSGFNKETNYFADSYEAPVMRALAETSSAKTSLTNQSLSGLDSSLSSAADIEKQGEQFYFSVTKPITIDAYKSIMLPISQGQIKVERVSVLSGTSAKRASLGAYITNTLGTPLPAGPIAVLDSGMFAGDALIEYLPAGDSRYISYGEDMLLSIFVSDESGRQERSIKIEKGSLYIKNAHVFEKTFVLKNLDDYTKTVIIEHTARYGADLKEPKKIDEKIEDGYRFRIEIPGGKEKEFKIREEQPLQEIISLSNLNEKSLLSYASTTNIPEKIRNALTKVAGFKRTVMEIEQELLQVTAERADLIKTQERTRLNLDAVGRDSSQGQIYIQKLMDSDRAIDAITTVIQELHKKQSYAEKIYTDYINNLILE